MLNREDRNAIDELFARLDEVERRSGPRDAEAEALIRQKMSAQPASPYYLAQTVIVQQRALQEAEQRLAELQDGRGRPARGPWDREPQEQRGGGFLAGAAQTALGVAGGMMLGSLIGSIFAPSSATAAEPAADDNADTGTGDDAGGFDGGDGFDDGGGFDFGGDF